MVGLPLLMRIRVIGTDVWVGKKDITYALEEASNPLKKPSYARPRQISGTNLHRDLPHWWVSEPLAKVWTTMLSLKKATTMGRFMGTYRFPDLEVVFADGSTKPLDEVMPPRRETP